MFLFIILTVLVEVLIALVILILLGFGVRGMIENWNKSKAELAKERNCRAELERIANLVIDYQKFPSTEKCQAANIKINVWNAACSNGSPLPLLDCAHQG